MANDANALVGTGLAIVGIVGIPLGVVLVRMWAKGERHDERIKDLERSHTVLEARVEGTNTVVQEIKLAIAAGFAEVKEQIRTLFRDQEKH